MKFSKTALTYLLTAGVGLGTLAESALAQAPDQYKWTVQYLIDNSQPVFHRAQKVFPRSNRSLALSPDHKFLYAGYNRSFGEKGELRKIDTTIPDYEDATVALLPGIVPKSIAVDSAGHVFVACENSINVYDPDLSMQIFAIEVADCEGLAIDSSNGTEILYATDHSRNSVKRYELQIANGALTGAKLTGFLENSGEIALPDAKDLVGVAVDTKHRIWVADKDGEHVYRVDADGKNLKSLELHSPIGIAFDGNKGFITRYQDRTVTIVDDEMNVVGTLKVPWSQLELAGPNGTHTVPSALSGIAIDPGKGFYVSNELGQTADQKSTYGRTDDASDVINGKLYTDSFMDDNDPILHAVRLDAADAAAATTTSAPSASTAASAPK